MKKLWTKFKHWLIKKLGGHVVKPIEPHITYTHHDVVSVSACVRAEPRHWFGDKSTQYRDMIIHSAKLSLAAKLADPEEDGTDVIQIDVDESRTMEDFIIVGATIRVAENR